MQKAQMKGLAQSKQWKQEVLITTNRVRGTVSDVNKCDLVPM